MRLSLIAATLVPLVLLGCKGNRETAIADHPAYPAATQSSVLDIHVLRHDTTISMTNTAARSFGPPARLWLNQWYSHEMPDFPVGASVTLSLADFKDRFGDPFRAGGFWATENPEKLVLAQVHADGEIVGLIVIGQSE